LGILHTYVAVPVTPEVAKMPSPDPTDDSPEAEPTASRDKAAPGDERPSVIDQTADLLQMGSDWVRQEAQSAVHDKLVIPMQRLGLTLASAYAAGCLLVLGLFWIEIAAIMLLGYWLHTAGMQWVAAYATAFMIIGGVAVLAAAIFLAIKMRYKTE
jgi:hypothetical protein